MASVRKRTTPTERPPLASEVSANFFADRECHVISVTNPFGRIQLVRIIYRGVIIETVDKDMAI
jgi:hypothetical protein